ncbi:short-chain dehydrogenase reductase ATA1 [Magnolia sinica]|uniref:short-chain dehydrogenase reductase ATA1 n=1 Tax=Magnolia sinica TaxID=86752 RepID=UPI00265852A3|nr:short-chain dehydrogenase reductase ATA1 [Magnolia sinica]
MLSGRLVKWMLLLSEYTITYELAKAVKGQAVVNFLAAHPVPDNETISDDFPYEQVMMIEPLNLWQMYFDGASKISGTGARVIFITPQGDLLPYSFTLVIGVYDHTPNYTRSPEEYPSAANSGRLLKGKVAIITGGARGIGAATAKLFALNGAHVIIADILDDLGPTLADSIDGRYIHCDVGRESDVESAVNLALAWRGQLDIMFSNAGVAGPFGSITNLDMDKMKDLLDVNICGMVHGIKHAARAMIRGKRGSIICTSSSAAIMGGLASHAYSLSKEAVLGLARSTACELGVHGIRVNCISPHGVPSEMLVTAYRNFFGKADMGPEEVGRIVGETGSLLRGRSASMEDVAQAALFLASDDAGFITAHNLIVDGGFTSAFSTMSFIYQ